MKESEIRPKAIFDEYLRLAAIDTKLYFSNSKKTKINCPACNKEGKESFKKNNFKYSVCNNCLTVFVSPRPSSESFSDYYRKSQSAKYWATTFYKKTEDARREKIWKPKAELILNELQKENANNFQIIDIEEDMEYLQKKFKNIFLHLLQLLNHLQIWQKFA